MAKLKTTSNNATLIRLKGTPFKTAGELKAQEILILTEEWENVERARVRRELLMKESNLAILEPLRKGIKAKFVWVSGEVKDNLVKVFLGSGNDIQVEIDSDLSGQDNIGAVEELVKPLVDGLLSGYLSALGLRNEGFVTPKKKLNGKRPK